jgi:hypothetical protein
MTNEFDQFLNLRIDLLDVSVAYGMTCGGISDRSRA